MAFAISRDMGRFEWSGHNLSTVFCQRWRILDPKMWRLIYDVFRFNACARRLIMGWNRLTSPLQGHDMPIGEYLKREGYSEQFSNDFLLVRPSLIVSIDTLADPFSADKRCRLGHRTRQIVRRVPRPYPGAVHEQSQPAANNRGSRLVDDRGRQVSLTTLDIILLQVVELINPGRCSKTYVDTILSALPPEALRLSSPVLSVRTLGSGQVLLVTASGKQEEYDHVIMACHADASLAILKAGGGVTKKEEEILGGFQWNKNVAVIHSDPKVFRRTRGSLQLPDLLLPSSCPRTRTRGRVGITSRSRTWTTSAYTVLTTTPSLGRFSSANRSKASESDIRTVPVSD